MINLQNGVLSGLGIFEEFTLYITADDLAAEITGDGTTRYTAESSKANYSEVEAEANPAWHPDIYINIPFEVDILDLYAELYWAQKATGGETMSYAKWQITGDGGSTWVDITDNVEEGGAVYVDKTRKGTTLALKTIQGGSGRFAIRLCTWIVDGDTVEVKVREDTYLKLVVRKNVMPA